MRLEHRAPRFLGIMPVAREITRGKPRIGNEFEVAEARIERSDRIMHRALHEGRISAGARFGLGQSRHGREFLAQSHQRDSRHTLGRRHGKLALGETGRRLVQSPAAGAQ